MIEIPADIDPGNIPNHVAIIMDGNGRWANERKQMRSSGHRRGAERVRPTVEACKKLGIKYLTLYAFSSENWKRSTLERNFLWRLLVFFIKKEIDDLNKEGVRLRIIGDASPLPAFAKREFFKAVDTLKDNTEITLTLALNYGGRGEIVRAIKRWHKEVVDGKTNPDELTETSFASYLDTSGIPDPELLIRTAGELRVSNFLLYQISYSEFFVTKTYWPDFSEETLFEAVVSYQKRVRKLGGVPDTEVSS